ncbi:MAG TPA: hypothetical protein VM884_06875 [Flavisolibacter sp.]|jgi:hypothetical protein|nr:hypothetical protein [Flavisolibacter sp.]
MKKTLYFLLLLFTINVLPLVAGAQCSVCTRTAQQLGEKPATSLNFGILYLAATPLAIAGIIGFRWWKKNRDV